MAEAVLGVAQLARGARASAPVRVADVGGWTDTWFGSPGRVCHLAVGPGVTAVARVLPADDAVGGAVHLVAPDVGLDALVRAEPVDVDPLLGHAVLAGLDGARIDPAVRVELEVRSAVPPGASLGTSAAVLVAVLAALDALVAPVAGRPVRSGPELARLAHEVETERAGRQAGVQDQWAAAMGGAGLLAIGPYPDVRHEALEVPAEALEALGDRLVTVVFGPHDSSAVHRQVIDALVTCSGVEHHHAREALASLSRLAGDAADALRAGDLERWAEVLVASVDAQAALHPGLVGEPHRRALDVARVTGARGWKVNGAGGDGGSLTVLVGPEPGAADALGAALAAADPTWRVLRLRPARGVAVATLR